MQHSHIFHSRIQEASSTVAGVHLLFVLKYRTSTMILFLYPSTKNTINLTPKTNKKTSKSQHPDILTRKNAIHHPTPINPLPYTFAAAQSCNPLAATPHCAAQVSLFAFPQ
jgi:hypothetical protein